MELEKLMDFKRRIHGLFLDDSLTEKTLAMSTTDYYLVFILFLLKVFLR